MYFEIKLKSNLIQNKQWNQFSEVYLSIKVLAVRIFRYPGQIDSFNFGDSYRIYQARKLPPLVLLSKYAKKEKLVGHSTQQKSKSSYRRSSQPPSVTSRLPKERLTQNKTVAAKSNSFRFQHQQKQKIASGSWDLFFFTND